MKILYFLHWISGDDSDDSLTVVCLFDRFFLCLQLDCAAMFSVERQSSLSGRGSACTLSIFALFKFILVCLETIFFENFFLFFSLDFFIVRVSDFLKTMT